MILYPAIDLRGGRVVRLTEGRFEDETIYSTDPLSTARAFASAGTIWLHVVDLDGAKDPEKRQNALIEALVAETGLRVQVGGGIREASQVEALLLAGASRVIVGSMAVREPALVREWLRDFGPERVVLALDVRPDALGTPVVAVSGWQQDSGKTLEAVLEEFVPAGLVHLLCTDISRDGRLGGPNFDLYAHVREKFAKLQVQASGGIATLEDLRRLRAEGAAGAITGRALYEGRFTLKEALAC